MPTLPSTLSDSKPRRRRIIGRHTGKARGPLVVCFGGMHGNEPAGVRALTLMMKMLEVEPIANPKFRFRGRLLALRGNARALARRRRFIHRDLNRMWTPDNVQRIRATDPEQLDEEELEILENLQLLEAELWDYQPRQMIVLDLHTTTAHGGIFSIATDDPESVRIAVELHAPVITGLLEGITGTSLHYFCSKNFGLPVTAVCFESGQHREPLSVNRAIAAITNCLRSVGCVRAEDVENQHDRLLVEYSQGLPRVARLLYAHHIRPDDQFRMQLGFKNFDPVSKGDLLAKDRNGPIYAKQNGLILMPLYQKRGSDGFFIVEQKV